MLVLEYIGNFLWVVRNIKDQCLTSPKVFYTIEDAVDWFLGWKSSFPSEVKYEVRYGTARMSYRR